MQSTTQPLAFGPTHNPWALERSTSGSSGGSCAAVAAGLVAIAAGDADVLATVAARPPECDASARAPNLSKSKFNITATGHWQCHTGDETGSIRKQEDGCLADIFGLTKPSQRHRPGHGLPLLGAEPLVH